MKTKKEIRKEISEIKKKMSLERKKIASSQIFNRLEKLSEFNQSCVILAYHSLMDEVFTHATIKRWSKNKTVLLPKVVGDDLELRKYSSDDDLKIGSYGIMEPCGELWTDYSAIDLAVIPGVAFDKEGNRLGRGKGYYDRLLPKLSCTKIGVCYPEQLLDFIPVDEHDISMDIVVSE